MNARRGNVPNNTPQEARVSAKMNGVDSANAPIYSCPECQKTGFKSISGIRKHFYALRHSRTNCPTCNRDFHSPHALLQHLHVHGAQKPAGQRLAPAPTGPVTSPAVATASSYSSSPPLVGSTGIPFSPKGNSQLSLRSTTRQSSPPASLTHKAGERQCARPPPTIMASGMGQPQGFKKRVPMPRDGYIQQPPPAETSRHPNPTRQNPSHPIIKPVPQPAIDEPTQQAALTHWLSDHCHSDALLSLRGFALESTPKQRKKKGETKTVPFDQFHATPDAIPGYGMRKAVALDCEMVELKAGRIVVAFLTAIDFFTGEILINHHVQPTERVVRWNTRKSGVTPQSMRNAVNRGEALFGWQNARRRLWDFVDSQTILIGHSLNNDLNVLGIFHRHIVDSSIVTGQAVFQDRNLRRTWALKTLAKELLEYDIQASKAGHSALEDTQATRDILIWCFRYPERLKTWADDNRIKEEERFAEEQRKAEIRRKEREEARKKKEVKEAALQKEDVGLVSAHPPGQQPGPGLQNNPSLGSSPSHTDLENGRNQRRRGRKDHTMIFASAISVRGPSSFL